jgi:predicted TIM-barrel fold metal-dependent hydrolase
MSIDVQTYIGHFPYRQLRGNSPQGLVQYMDRWSISQTVVANLNGVFYRYPQPANEELAAAIRPYPGRFIPFAVLNPTYPGWKADLETCHGKLGMKGLRLYPQYHGYKLSDPRFEQMLEAASALGMPVAFSRWLEDPRQRSWLDTSEELRLDDLVPVLANHPGTFLLHSPYIYPVKDEHVRVFRQAKVYFDTVFATATISAWSGYDILSLIKLLGPDRFLFGSAYPLRDPVTAQVRLSILKELDRGTMDAIWGGNARRLLHL